MNLMSAKIRSKIGTRKVSIVHLGKYDDANKFEHYCLFTIERPL